MFKSIRWNLLGGQALILAAVVFGFGLAMYLRVRSATLEQVDANLLGAAQVVAEKGQRDGTVDELEIPAAYRHRFGEVRADAPYLVVWDAGGRVQIESGDIPSDLPPCPDLPPRDGPRPYIERSRGSIREMIVRGPGESRILVGRHIGREENEFRRLFWWLVATGVAVVGIGMAGAWFLSRRILAPVERMSAIAERISASNLSQRIDETKIKSELGRLAQVLNKMFERLEASFMRQTRFTADASHELRTPTAVILIQSELALVKERSPEEYQKALAACHRAAKRLQALVDGLLTLARLDAGQGEESRERIDLKLLVENTIALVSPLAEKNRIEVKSDLQSVSVLCNVERLIQALANLVANAITYNREGGKICIRLTAVERNAVLCISDTGIGIAASELPKIFERFYRVDKSRTGDGGGVGLGLAICREIIASNGGKIDVASVVGKGTTFTVQLPLISGASLNKESIEAI